MKADIVDHSLVIVTAKRAVMVRPCADLSGRFSFIGELLPFGFSKRSFKESNWSFFAIPFLLFSTIRLEGHGH